MSVWNKCAVSLITYNQSSKALLFSNSCLSVYQESNPGTYWCHSSELIVIKGWSILNSLSTISLYRQKSHGSKVMQYWILTGSLSLTAKAVHPPNPCPAIKTLLRSYSIPSTTLGYEWMWSSTCWIS